MPDPGGVVHSLGPLPPVPPGPIAAMIKSQVHQVLAEIPDGKNGALVAVGTAEGINLAVAHRTGDHFTVVAWIGKSWTGPLDGGASVRATW